jgi:glyoxylate reductase
MPKPKIFVTRLLPEKGVERIIAMGDTEVWPDELPPPYEILREKVSGVDGLVCLLTDRIDAGLMDAAGPGLKVISQMAVGYDNIDIGEATARGIPVGNTPGVLTETTADFAFAMLMAAARRIVEGDRYVKAESWKTWGPTLMMGHDIHDATLGIIGFGRIGQAVAKRARGFSMRVLFYDPLGSKMIARSLHAQSVALDQLLAESDFVSLHVPLNGETEHMIGGRELKLMKATSVLINTSRGPVVDPQALYRALAGGEIAYAALDVTEPEPIDTDDPLLTLENCIIVPHIASSSLATRTKMALMASENLVAGLNGVELPNCINPEVYGKISDASRSDNS